MATIIDLSEGSQPESHAACDVCIVGAGAAGHYLAARLTRAGRSVVVLEAGGRTSVPGSSLGIEPVLTAGPYGGVDAGRAFGWGGTTSRWGGLLIPHSDLDLRAEATPESVAWRRVVDVVGERSAAVFSALELDGPPDFFSYPNVGLGPHAAVLRARGIETVAAQFLPFQRRNLSYLAAASPRGRLTVYLNAVASEWILNPARNGRPTVETVGAATLNGKRIRVSAKSFVVAAGAIESARILLEIHRTAGDRLFPASVGIGRYLSDHLSCIIAQVNGEDQPVAAERFGPRFSHGRMRSFRFIVSSREPSVARHFAHFIFDIDNAGFRVAKEFLSALQRRSRPTFSLAEVVEAVGGLGRLAYHRYLRSQLFVPSGTPAHLQLDVEQSPDPENRIRLGEDRDRWGRPVAVVRWRVSDVDVEHIRRTAARILERWPGRALGFPRLLPVFDGDTRFKPHDAYHPVGTCRMGTDEEATVDLDLRVKETENLFVLSTGVLPSAGSANPTFSMLCLGDVLADRLARHAAPTALRASASPGIVA